MVVEVLIIIIGVAVILGLAEITIRYAIELGVHFKLSGGFIGLTILSVGTSIPEIMTHVVGSVAILRQPETMNTLSGLLIGTNIGSDIFQQNFVLPVIGLVGTVLVTRQRLFEEVGALVGAAALVWVFTLGGAISRLEGAILVLAYIAYLLFLARENHLIQHVSAQGNTRQHRVFRLISIIALSFIIMAVVTDRVVGAATILVEQLPISPSFFGVIFLGIATALPELTTSLVSIFKGEKGISAGILIGSNLTNPLLGIGVGAVISRYTVPDVVVFYDLPVKIATAIVLYLFLLKDEDLNRQEAIILIFLFLAYVYARSIIFPEDFVVG